MQIQIPESELILNSDGSIYHLNLRPEEMADTIILVGDPDRVPMVSKFLDSIEIKKQKREFITHTGYLNNKRISVLSTGIGGDNIDIVIQELDALANINLQSRTIKESLKKLRFIRLGTCGSFHPDVDVDSIVLSSIGIGLDGLMNFYEVEEDPEAEFLKSHVISHFRQNNLEVLPYIGRSNNNLLDSFQNLDNVKGITLTLGGFYGPQGRVLRLPNRSKTFEEMVKDFEFNDQRIMNLEMETAAIYSMSNALGHEALSVSVIIANRSKKEFSKNPKKAVENMITDYLEAISLLP